MECYFQASPEMFEWVQDRASAWGLKGRKSWTEDNVSLKEGPSAHMMLSIMKKLLYPIRVVCLVKRENADLLELSSCSISERLRPLCFFYPGYASLSDPFPEVGRQLCFAIIPWFWLWYVLSDGRREDWCPVDWTDHRWTPVKGQKQLNVDGRSTKFNFQYYRKQSQCWCNVLAVLF